MAARITEVCAGVLELLEGIIHPAPPDVAEAAYSPSDVLETVDGKRVRVLPISYGDAQRLARRRVQKGYKVATVVEIPYTAASSPAASGAIPPEWVDQQIAWVEAHVFDPLNETYVHAADGLLLGSLTCWACEVAQVYDPLRLAEEKLFVSIVETEYRESESEGG